MRCYQIISVIFLFSLMIGQNWDSRDRWQKADEIIKAMNLMAGSSAADIGCKDGYLTIKLAKAVGEDGAVFAVDIDESALDDLQKNLDERKIANVRKVLGLVDNPKLNENSLDAAVILNAYHEMDDYPAMLKHIKAALKKGGRLVIVDGISNSRRKSSRKTQTNKHELAIDLASNDLIEAGFRIIEKTEQFVSKHPWRDEQWILVAVPASD
ncbi:MAG: class I SAM-dependent methyltransferase [Calditrichaeota bacterium]|nr:class I SAM-dependent methyltransferase [Calditrichota bacterium]